MTDYEKAFKDGIKAARNAERAREEVNSVFCEFDKQMRILSEGKIGIDRSELTVKNLRFLKLVWNIYLNQKQMKSIGLSSPIILEIPKAQ